MLLANMVLDRPMSHPAHAQTADSSIEYPENGTSPVGAFIAHDQDGDPIRWSLSGPDAALFTIDGGVLAFREPPNYEVPRSAATRNPYRVTVEASGGAHDVAVTVIDVDEPGTVSIDRPQPQVDRPLGAGLSDEDAGVTDVRWQWARSEDGTAWTDIDRARSPARTPEPEDEGMYLRATATYTDKFGPGKTASAVSANRVEARTLANAAPSFAAQDDDESTPYVDIARSVPENAAVGANVGRAVAGMDPDGDVLFYELLDTPDLRDADGDARFTIDSLTGQLRVGRELGADAGEREDEDSTALDGEPALPEGEDAGEAGNSVYVLRVRASDPSTASATANVIVTVVNMNEPPRFDVDAPTVLRVTEVVEDEEDAEPPDIALADGVTGIDAGTYAVTDQDDEDDDTSYTYSVSGPDRRAFFFDGDNVLRFRPEHLPDYEAQSSYSITVVARSGEGPRRLTATLDVTIEVANAEDPGSMLLSQRQPQVGTAVHATISDPDGGVTVTRWVWERSAESAGCRTDPGGWIPIDEATSPAYDTQPADVGRCLRVTATYTDNVENAAGAGDERLMEVVEAPVQAVRSANAAPHFERRAVRTSRRVFENTEPGQNIGKPLTAHDDDGDLLVYTLGGADAASFRITRNDGQLKTSAPLDREARSRYTVEVTATDPSGAATGILVTITVLNVDEPARIIGISSVDYSENSTAAVGVFLAFDQDRSVIRWSLSGPDEDRFTITGGVLRFMEAPDYEEPLSAVEGVPLADRNVYRVTVEAAGAERDVTVTVTDVDEAGTVKMDRPQPQVDRRLTASLSDEDEVVTAERWQWARSGDEVTWTDIEGATAPGRYPTADDVDKYLRATVTYTDKFGADKTTSAVSANRVEPRTLANAAPSFVDQDEDRTTLYIDVARSVPENTPVGTSIGEPLSATDTDEDVLFYELLDTPDLEDADGHVRFTIDSASGQIRVGKVLGADAGERGDVDSTALTDGPPLPVGEVAGAAGNSMYVLRVRVSDPSTASDTVNVIVTVDDVNEPPRFDEDAPTMLRVEENQKDEEDQDVNPPVITLEDGTAIEAATFAVTDQDGDNPLPHSVSGPDRRFLYFGSGGVLRFRAQPDYERKSSYSITVLARSGVDDRTLTAALPLTIEVVNTEDPGTVTLSQRQPQVDFEISATLTDPDGGVTIAGWEWDRSDASTQCRDYDGDWTPIDGATSAVYEPQPDDVGTCLRATATYTDNIAAAGVQTAVKVLEFPVRLRRSAAPSPGPEPDGGFVNAAPVFPDQDFLTPGDQSDTTSREIPENTSSGQNIGSPVWAHDEDDDPLIYRLSGADARHFSISRRDGQLKTRAPLNYEARSTYTVTVTATDPFGASDSIEVTITVTDEDDPPVITVNTSASDDGP